MRERPPIRRGLALIVVVGILGVTAALAVAFVTMAQLERKASQQRTYAAKAALLSRSGIEDALARLGMGQDGAYGGEDWNGNGSLDGIEVGAEVYKPGVLNTDDCPVRYALRPSFFVKDPSNPALPPALSTVDGRQRGYSGRLSGDRAAAGNVYALRVRPLNDRIYVNGGALDAQDRDPDGPTPAVTWPLDPNQEINPLSAGAGGDYRNTAMEGPNGFLVRLLDNLDDIVTGGATSNLGVQVVSNRPLGGYRSLSDLKAVLGQARYDQFQAYLTVQAWVDPKVVKPQPMDSRPWRWQDIDPAHRVGASATAIAGITTSPPPRTGNLFLNSGVLGLAGTEADPWMQTVTQTKGNNVNSDVTTTSGGVDTERVINYLDTTAFSYPVKWERNFVYAWSQLRIGPPAMEPRAPVSLNTAPEAVLACALEGLKGTYLKVWEGDAGWDDNGWLGKGNDHFGGDWAPTSSIMTTSEWTPWYMTRADYGMSYKRPSQGIDLNGDGVVNGKDDIRSWYGPRDFDENSRATLIHTEDNPDPSGRLYEKDYGAQERGLVQSRPLGRLTETPPITRDQAQAVAAQIRRRILRMGPLRTWAEFNAFVDRLPAWEDLDNNGVLDGTPHLPIYNPNARRAYQREDLNSNGVMDREIFPASPSSAAWPRPAWTNLGTSPLSAGQTAGLTFVQKDLIKAMANPNTDLNDFNPDANLWKEADKTDVAGLLRPVSPRRPGREWAADPGNAYVHTTEFCLDPPGDTEIVSAGRVTDAGGRLLAQRQMRVLARVQNLYRDTTQADFMRDYIAGKPLGDAIAPTYTPPSPSPAPYPLAGSPRIPPAASGPDTLDLRQALVSYPEPQTYCDDVNFWPRKPNRRGADADYDGQIGLGFIGPKPGPDETLRGSLFDTLDAEDSGDRASVTDARGPWHRPLVRGPGPDTGNIFPDGVYSEKDRSLMVPLGSILLTPSVRFNQDSLNTEILVRGVWKPSNPAGVHFYLGSWVKPNWFPEASPRPHALLSLSRGDNPPPWTDSSNAPDVLNDWYENSYGTAIQANTQNPDRTQNTPTRPLLLSFFPGGNNIERVTSAWGSIPSHTLLWGVPAAAGSPYAPGPNGLYISDDLNLRGVYEDLAPPHPIGRLEAHRWQHIAVTGTIPQDRGYLRIYVGRVTGASTYSYNYGEAGLGAYYTVLDGTHDFTGETNHIRFGETSAENNMNDVADATFANVRAGTSSLTGSDGDDTDPWPGTGAFASHYGFLSDALSPAALGRYYKESDASPATRAVFTGPALPAGIRPLRAAWTEIPCDLWFDRNGDGWMDTLANDQFGSGGAPGPNGKRDVRIDLEVWDDMGTPGVPGDDVLLASFSDAGGANTIPPLRTPGSRLYYKAVFVNEWDAATRAGSPLDVTPYLDDVTITYTAESGPEILLWEDGHDVD